jgi:hypothetical protein
MRPARVVSGRLTPDGVVELDEPVSLSPGPVRIAIEVLADANGPSPGLLTVDAKEWEKRKAAIDAAIGCLSDEDAERILRIVESEFERIDADESR